MSKILDSLNSQQREAAEQLEGPVLIIAGAGSGKTRALTHRLAHLLEHGIPHHKILALTFTNKAAGEMRERVKELVGGARMPFVGTFHALGVRILREEALSLSLSPNFVIYDSKDQRALVKDLMERHNLPTDRFQAGAVHSLISRQKNELVTPHEFEQNASTYFERLVAPVYRSYEEDLRAAQAVDFDDLLILPVRLFRSRPDVLEKYHKRFTYYLVDEYQDTNHAQYVLITLLSKKHRNLCVVGDDWQSIYRFRGADFRNILNFEKDWPDAKIIFLEENYRSTQPILNAAQAVIEQNQFRTHKKLWTKEEGEHKPQIVRVSDEVSEGIYVLDMIESLVGSADGPQSLSECVVLYRTNAQSRIFEELLIGRSTPYKIVGAVRFYERREVKDLLAYLRLIFNSKDVVSLKRIANTPPRGIGAKTLSSLLSNVDREHGKRAHDFFSLMNKFRDAAQTFSLEDLLKLVMDKTDYKKYLNPDSLEGRERWENVQELVSVTSAYELRPAKETLPHFLEEVALLSPVDEIDEGSGALNLMTLHAVKGLEFDTVFVVGCEEGILPHEKSVTRQEDIEEERRLLYVGMTRARKRLYLMFTRERTLFGSSSRSVPSRFLGDIPEEMVDYKTESDELIQTIEI